MSASDKKRLVADFWRAFKASRGSRGVMGIEYSERCKCVVIHKRHGDIFLKAADLEGPALTQLIMENV